MPQSWWHCQKMTRKEIDVLDEDECRRFLTAAEGERLRTLFSVALSTGMRPEEYLVLQWKDVDMERRTAAVRRVLVRVGGQKWQFSEPKTKLSSRIITLPTGLIEKSGHIGRGWQKKDFG